MFLILCTLFRNYAKFNFSFVYDWVLFSTDTDFFLCFADRASQYNLSN